MKHSKENMESNLKAWNEKISDDFVKYKVSRQSVIKLKKQLKENKEKIFDLLEAQKIFQITAKGLQHKVHSQISSLVSKCVSAVFGSSYGFRINFVEKRGKTEAELQLIKDNCVCDIINENGGGVVDIVSFALRLSTLLLTRPSPRKIMILDEPFKFVSKKYRDRVNELLRQLSDDLDVQFIIVTHIDEFKIGKIINIT